MEWNGAVVSIMKQLEWTDRNRYINRNDSGLEPERPQTANGTTRSGKMDILTFVYTVLMMKNT